MLDAEWMLRAPVEYPESKRASKEALLSGSFDSHCPPLPSLVEGGEVTREDEDEDIVSFFDDLLYLGSITMVCVRCLERQLSTTGVTSNDNSRHRQRSTAVN